MDCEDDPADAPLGSEPLYMCPRCAELQAEDRGLCDDCLEALDAEGQPVLEA
jgi:hypothetical protein